MPVSHTQMHDGKRLLGRGPLIKVKKDRNFEMFNRTEHARVEGLSCGR